MTKIKTIYVCQDCGTRHPRWMGQCASCGAWNSLVEQLERPSDRRAAQQSAAAPAAVRKLADIDLHESPRLVAGMAEWDRVLGGGIVPGSIVLVGGDPGVGKSTLLMDVADAVARGGKHGVLYVSGEESLRQIGLRARRLGLSPQGISFAAETDVGTVIDAAIGLRPAVVIVDSVQSVYDPEIESSPGSVVQLRECTIRLQRLAKEQDIAVMLVGHVTKEGAIAGPKVLEHIVDVVLYLEGEHLQSYRLLRGVKNRFGATSEVGVFEMRDEGMVEVPNPSALFLGDREDDGTGSSVAVTLQGTRPILVEVQALVTRSKLAVPRRVATGLDFNRLILLASVLSKRGGVPLYDYDVHVNIVGGLRIEETAADLALSLAMLSSYHDAPMAHDTIAIGEIGLGGELRRVGQMELRMREAAKLGFRRAIVPARSTRGLAPVQDLEILEAATLRQAAALTGLHAGKP
jgi:DNA repair protein RadA/Sms